MLIYFMKGKLPWQNIKISKNYDKYKAVKDMKINIPIDILCNDLPMAFS